MVVVVVVVIVVAVVVIVVVVVVMAGFRYIDDEDEDLMENCVRRSFSLTSEVAREEGVLVVAEGELATTFTHLLEKEVARVAAVVAEGEGREVAEVGRGEAHCIFKKHLEGELTKCSSLVWFDFSKSCPGQLPVKMAQKYLILCNYC